MICGKPQRKAAAITKNAVAGAADFSFDIIYKSVYNHSDERETEVREYMDIFGKLFDFNGDGKVDPAEELTGLDMIGFFDDEDEDEEEDEDD